MELLELELLELLELELLELLELDETGVKMVMVVVEVVIPLLAL